MWLPLGTLNPSLEWQAFPSSIANSNLIKVSFSSAGNLNSVLSFCWIRRVWSDTSPKQVDPAFRAYPKSEQILYPVPIPQELIEIDQVTADWEVKLGMRQRNYSEPTWDISIEAWF